jgi:hypothetical protein
MFLFLTFQNFNKYCIGLEDMLPRAVQNSVLSRSSIDPTPRSPPGHHVDLLLALNWSIKTSDL